MVTHLDKSRDYTNRLIHEASLYLLQHAHNPVNWYPWGEEAFRRAKEEDKLIFLSIGYSACHWCHVMAHESFENEAIAKIMNAHFVNIKVDREEYLDVDHLYQTFVQMSTGRGGWPLSVFLTPGRVPIYGGTYFPAESRYAMISFPDLLRRVVELRENDPGTIAKSAEEVRTLLKNMSHLQARQEPVKEPGFQPDPPASEHLPEAEQWFADLYTHLESSFDSTHGGFGGAPKFPHFSDLEFLLNYYHYTGKQPAKEMVLLTLSKMAQGGIYDHIGGGFHRYSTDALWRIPHFEKMLYDNALLIPVYANAYRLTGRQLYRQIAVETADFVLREMTDVQGGFYSTLDADSEGEEGKYYLWHYQEARELLDETIRNAFCDYYNLSLEGNFEGMNILHITEPLETLAERHGFEPGDLRARLAAARKQLLKARSQRVRPGLDNKILTDWNGMMISALWEVFQITGEMKYRTAAEKAVEFLTENFMDGENRLFHLWRNNDRKITAYLDDYAFFIGALIDGFETTQQSDYLRLAVQLADYTLTHFWDERAGGFYFTDKESDTTITRIRQHFDASTPAGNSVMVQNLLRLESYTGRAQFLKNARQTFRVYKNEIVKQGGGVTSLMTALLYNYFSPVEITISVPEGGKAGHSFDAIFKLFIPNRVFLRTSPGLIPEWINPQLVENRNVADQEVVFICYQKTCSLPIHSQEKIPEILAAFNLRIR